MINKSLYKNLETYKLIIVLLPICYLLFPNNNQTLDAWEYAQNVKYGTDLFKAHHLLYNWFLYSLKSFPLFKSIDTIRFMQFVNGIFILLSLYILYRIIFVQYNDKKKALVWTFLVGCSYASLRYGTENETYVIPIFFSILASYFFLQYIRQRVQTKFLFLSGLFSSISCLFHQIHFFWWLALLIGIFLIPYKKIIKELFVYALPALIVPAAYTFVMYFNKGEEITLHNFLSFVFEYYYSESADVGITNLNFILTPISLLRSFIAVHGNIINFFIAKPIVCSLSIVFTCFCICKFLASLKFEFNFKVKNAFVNIHCIGFVLHLTFAFYSQGNAEFMVMLPFLLTICLSHWLSIHENKIFYLSLAMLTWNMTFFILPSYFYNFQNNEKLMEIVKSHPENKFILKNRHKIVAQYKYFYDVDISDRVFFVEDIVVNNEDGIFLTDIFSKKQPFNRASIVEKKEFGFKYTPIKKITEIQAFYGNYFIDEVLVEKSTNH